MSSIILPPSRIVLTGTDRTPGKTVGHVKIFGRAPGPYTLSWLDRGTSGTRQRTMRADWARAKKAAEQINTALINSRHALGQLDEAGAAEYLRCRDVAARYGRGVESIVMEHAELIDQLAGATPRAAARYYLDSRPAAVNPKTVPDAVTSLLEQKRKAQAGAKWLRTLTHQLDIFAKKFTGPIHLLQVHELNKWLWSLDCGLRTRKNYRDAIRELFRYAAAENLIDRLRAQDLIKGLDRIKPPPTEAQVWTPDQMAHILGACHDNLLPLVVLIAFGGIRHEEISPEDDAEALLDWSNIDLVKGTIRVPKTVAKTKRMRLIKMRPNLIAWLKLHAKRSGPICDLGRTGDALSALGDRAGIPWVKNALRNSFITYRLAATNDIALVAREAGNSAKVIHDEYLELATEEQGKAWFDIHPPEPASIIQLDFAFK